MLLCLYLLLPLSLSLQMCVYADSVKYVSEDNK